MSCLPGDVAGKTEQQYEKTEYDQRPKGRTGKPKYNKIIFGAAAAVCGRGSIVSEVLHTTLSIWSPVTLSAISFLICQPRFPFDRYPTPPYSLGCHP